MREANEGTGGELLAFIIRGGTLQHVRTAAAVR